MKILQQRLHGRASSPESCHAAPFGNVLAAGNLAGRVPERTPQVCPESKMNLTKPATLPLHRRYSKSAAPMLESLPACGCPRRWVTCYSEFSPDTPMTTRPAFTPLPASDFAAAFPQSRKIHVDGAQGVRVPMREIVLTNGDTLRVYDSSGPHGHDVRQGLPKLRESWVAPRRPCVPEEAHGGAEHRRQRPSSAQPARCVTQLP